ncbi:Jip4p NDAI_0H00960 [Naumovozyma dairenensis CBS 421]|uniref:Uncharacterized protein n=1 Tax=Naumovozyma dairenensis (strain ATCC 10597 / BCRC 20456 / CBS 421 / NBRC 0211 / NRRL Y-12639) TaxID=1071378 RepID=G0WEQ9_NAUDC|nr:hypothetical protein NDAI_0H00960 [Naumovozyma dairenensis CBS 421]CCD26270.1 hypothetical protein NDAI_0H00960 [Naumovozyma dairenensis CBS 421]
MFNSKHENEMLRKAYRHLTLYPPAQSSTATSTSPMATPAPSSPSPTNPYPYLKYKPCVSFNTVPITSSNLEIDKEYESDFPGVQLYSTDYTMDEFYDNESGYISDNSDFHQHDKYITSSSFSNLRNRSPPPRSSKGNTVALGKLFKIAENGKIVREDYPSRPTVSNEAVVINRIVLNYEKLSLQRKRQIDKRLDDKPKFFKYSDILFSRPNSKIKKKSKISEEEAYVPLTKEQKRKEKILNEQIGYPTNPRTIICHLSGRRHTWVSLDWTIKQFAQDTDNVVIVANIPKMRSVLSSSTNARSRSMSRSRSRSRMRQQQQQRSPSMSPTRSSFSNDYEWTSGYNKTLIEQKLRDIFEYISLLLSKSPKSIKISVEIIIGKTKKMFTDVIDIYTPDFIVSSTLKWERTDNLVRWKSKTLTDKLCTSFPIPVFVVPAMRMFEFEIQLAEQFPSSSSLSSFSTFQKDYEKGRRPVLLHANTTQTPAIFTNDIANDGTVPYRGPDSNNYYHTDAYSSDDLYSKQFDNLLISQEQRRRDAMYDSTDTDEYETSDDDDDSTNENEDQISINSENSTVSLKTKLHKSARKHRREMINKMSNILNDPNLNIEQKQLSRLDIIIDSSLKFSLEMELLPIDSLSNNNNNKGVGFEKLKNVLTRQDMITPPSSKKSMLDVAPQKTKKKKQTALSSPSVPKLSRTREEENGMGTYHLTPVRSYDIASTALSRATRTGIRDKSPLGLSPVPSAPSKQQQKLNLPRMKSYDDTLRKVRSNEFEKRSYNNSPVRIQSPKSSNKGGGGGGGGGGLFSFFSRKPSSPSARSDSSDYDSDYIGFKPQRSYNSLKPSKKTPKKKTGLFGWSKNKA